ncbi:hypothetical protein SK128_018802, partial [Halocaridina rubra]
MTGRPIGASITTSSTSPTLMKNSISHQPPHDSSPHHHPLKGRLRAFQLAQSQPNLADIGMDEVDDDDDIHHEVNGGDETLKMNGLRTVLSNPNLLDDEPEQTQ